LNRNRNAKNEQSQVWYRGKNGFIAFVTLTAVFIVSFLAGFSLHVQRQRASSLPSNSSFQFANFTCAWAGSGYPNEAFTVTVDVNLTDGMNLDEAIRVAAKVFNVTMGQNMLCELNSTCEDENGIWTVEFAWEYASALYLGHWFETVIDPFNQTVVFDRCK